MLNVWVSNDVVGAIDRLSEEVNGYVFAYQLPFRSGHEVSLTMPYSLESYPYEYGLPPIFQMNLPEGALLSSLERTFRKLVPDFDDLNLLEIVGNSQIGRLRFSNNASDIDQIPLQSVDELIAYSGAENLFQYLMERFSAMSGVSGVQPKVLIRDADNRSTKDGRAKLTVKGATHIVKTWDEYPQLAANEFFSMKAAQRSGLSTPSMQLTQDNRLLIIERFDLAPSGDYLGFEDFCCLSGIGTRGKYNSSYEDLAKSIRLFVAPEYSRTALEQYFRTLVLSCTVKNGDAHLKNFGVLYESPDKPVTMAPVYDIVTTGAYIKDDPLALLFNGSKRYPDAQALIKFASIHCNISTGKAKSILSEVAESVISTKPEIKQHIKDYPEFKQVGERMLAVWDKGIDLTCTIPSKKVSLGTSTVIASKPK